MSGTAFVTIGTETSGHAVHATLCTLVASRAASPAWAAHGAVLLSADAVAFFAARLSSSNPFGGTASAASSVTIPIPRGANPPLIAPAALRSCGLTKL